ncbi:hypothetical protein M0813_19298 [Anaeramoeba flamelloides]|uniref:Uncharacterized protein n=1 Tax=Anaeramoeba flamelloides TaxID=1746091 RepID=A0ABQ8YPW7_9EUKA|nr:hypothetical protein M0813_19298 [Anaeramoeba flamelloides]
MINNDDQDDNKIITKKLEFKIRKPLNLDFYRHLKTKKQQYNNNYEQENQIEEEEEDGDEEFGYEQENSFLIRIWVVNLLN